MFFFFFDLYEILVIKQAFQKVCVNKMLSDGYFDMSTYIFARINKEEMLSALITSKSPYAILYKNSYPKKDNAITMWNQYFNNDNPNSEVQLTDIEAKAIVNWVYRAFSNSQERITITKEIFKNIKELHAISNNIQFVRGVFYNKEKVDIHFISSISALNETIVAFGSTGKQLFYRGHANSNYILLPSVMRTKDWRENERAMYNELLINCPEDFEKCLTHLEKLVKMQHYGLPTRLLDITRNPLVALYFACNGEYDSFGEIVLIAADIEDIKYPQSDTVSILASLPQFSYSKQIEFYRLAIDTTINDASFNSRVSRLLHEIRLEKPAFQPQIIKNDLLRNIVVYALKNNNRIIKQDGAFILTGLFDEKNNSLNKFRYKEKGKTVILLTDKKKRVLKQLDAFSINHATLFPEIECVAEYIKNNH